jgi:hypothetical protein
MAEVLIFPQSRVVRTHARSPRVEELEMRILEHLRILQHRSSDETVGEILRLREEIWRVEAEDVSAPRTGMGWPRGH